MTDKKRRKVLPIGSVFRLGGKQFVAVGYRPVEKDGAVALAYILFPWPLGFLNRQSVYLCPVSEASEALAEGYQSEAGDRFLRKMEEIEEKGKEADYGELMRFMKAVKENPTGGEEK